MTNKGPEQRKFPRFETDVRVHFVLPYDFRTEVDFEVHSETKDGHPHKYVGFSKNISAHGLCFESNKEIASGAELWIELHLPDSHEIIYMRGQVCWSQVSVATPEAPKTYLTGVRVGVVDGVDVEQTVYFDQKYHVLWSELLERVLGGFAKARRHGTKTS